MNQSRQDPLLPWFETDNDRWFKRILQFSLVMVFVAGATVPHLPVPKPERKKLVEVSPHLAKLVFEKQKQRPVTSKVRQRTVEKVRLKHLLITESEFAALPATFGISFLKVSISSPSTDPLRPGYSKFSTGEPAQDRAKEIDNALFPSHTDKTPRPGRHNSTGKNNVGFAKDYPGPPGRVSRSREEIARVFEKNHSAIFSLYHRALRKEPRLQGRVVLELTITPHGKVSKCRIISSELGNTSLEKKLVARIKRFRFKTKQVQPVTITYPIDFLPS